MGSLFNTLEKGSEQNLSKYSCVPQYAEESLSGTATSENQLMFYTKSYIALQITGWSRGFKLGGRVLDQF